jgi:hypothetical protein
MPLYYRCVAVRAVIFDWGGTLTPWHHIDHEDLCGALITNPGRIT